MSKLRKDTREDDNRLLDDKTQILEKANEDQDFIGDALKSLQDGPMLEEGESQDPNELESKKLLNETYSFINGLKDKTDKDFNDGDDFDALLEGAKDQEANLVARITGQLSKVKALTVANPQLESMLETLISVLNKLQEQIQVAVDREEHDEMETEKNALSEHLGGVISTIVAFL